MIILSISMTVPPSEISIFDAETDKIVSGDIIYALIGSFRDLRCTVPSPMNPQPNITWSANGVILHYHDQINKAGTNESHLMISSRSVTIAVMQDDQNRNVTCFVEHFGLIEALQEDVMLSVGSKLHSSFSACALIVKKKSENQFKKNKFTTMI